MATHLNPPDEPPDEPPQDPAGDRAVVYTVIHSVFGAGLLYALLSLVPSFQKIFDEFGVELPGSTVLLIVISYGARNYWYLLVILGAGAIALDFALLKWLGKVKRSAQTALGVLLILLPLGLLILLILSIALPLLGLMQSLA